MQVVLSKTSLGIIRKLSYTFPSADLRSLYYSLIHPYFEYCNIARRSSETVFFHKLLSNQKKALRLIDGQRINSHAALIFKTYNILNLSDINVLRSACFMYEAVNLEIPSMSNHHFVHNHFTRKSTDVHIIQCRLKVCVESIKFRGPRSWNSIDLHVRLSKSICIFKRKYKSYLLGQYL